MCINDDFTIGNSFVLFQSSGRSKSGDDVDIRMLVHQSQAGCIIGKGGLKIKELREVSVISLSYHLCCVVSMVNFKFKLLFCLHFDPLINLWKNLLFVMKDQLFLEIGNRLFRFC